MMRIVRRDRSMAEATRRGSPPTSVTSEASMATSVPVPMAMPRSAGASAGASLMPSPTMATDPAIAWSARTRSALSPGRTSAMTRRVDADLARHASRPRRGCRR